MLSLLQYLKTGKILIVVCLFLFKNNIFSQNLVQNGSFELNSNIDCSTGTYTVINNWNGIGTPDYFHSTCPLYNNNVPFNRFGESYEINNNKAYIGIVTYYKTSEYKEYIQQQLTSPLITGKSYYLSFYTSKADRVGYSTNNTGAFFSVNQPTVIGNNYFPANPQVINNIGYITDTTTWTKIEGYFKAAGGEQYITIGNFNSNTNTDTLNTGTANPIPFDPGEAYYYIDSVSLYDSLDYALITNVKKLKDEIIVNLYPNPNNGNFKLEYHIDKESDFIITDITGRIVNQYSLLPKLNNLLIKDDELNAGVYFYSIKINNSLLKNDKLVIIK